MPRLRHIYPKTYKKNQKKIKYRQKVNDLENNTIEKAMAKAKSTHCII